MNGKVLVTGGCGYIGSILTPKLLEQGLSVTVLDNLLYRQTTLLDLCSNKNFSFVKGDITDALLMNKLISKHDIVVPLAAIVGAPACASNPALAELTNSDAPLRMLNLLSKDQMVLFPTTNSGYGIGKKGAFCDENSPLKPLTRYAQAKVELENAYLQKGNAITFRLATVFGMSPRMRADLLVNDFVVRAIKDKFIVLFEEQFRRNFVHVRDVANVFVLGINEYENMKGEPYNVGLSSANLTKLGLCEKIKEHVPELEIYSSEVGKDPDQRDYIVSNEKIEAQGWTPKHSLDDGIKELIKGYSLLQPNMYANI